MKGKALSAFSKFCCSSPLPVNNSVPLLAERLGSWALSAFLRSNLLYFPANRYQCLIHFWSISRSSDDVLIPTACTYCGFQRCDTYWCIKMPLLSSKMCFVWMCPLKSDLSPFPPTSKSFRGLQTSKQPLCSWIEWQITKSRKVCFSVYLLLKWGLPAVLMKKFPVIPELFWKLMLENKKIEASDSFEVGTTHSPFLPWCGVAVLDGKSCPEWKISATSLEN